MVHHINTIQEITPKAESVFQFLRQNEIRQLNQSVLLAKVNDSSEKLEKLILKLSSCGISPYYLHQLDKVEGASHFEVEQKVGLQIIAELKEDCQATWFPVMSEIQNMGNRLFLVWHRLLRNNGLNLTRVLPNPRITIYGARPIIAG